MARVLRPGGHAFVVTECFVGRHPLNSRLLQTAVRLATLQRLCRTATPGRRVIDVMTWREAYSRIVRGSGLELLQPPDLKVSPETADNLVHFGGDGVLRFRTGKEYPHVLLEAYGAPWTSLALALRKQA